jgi:hypothetical protein
MTMHAKLTLAIAFGGLFTVATAFAVALGSI